MSTRHGWGLVTGVTPARHRGLQLRRCSAGRRWTILWTNSPLSGYTYPARPAFFAFSKLRLIQRLPFCSLGTLSACTWDSSWVPVLTRLAGFPVRYLFSFNKQTQTNSSRTDVIINKWCHQTKNNKIINSSRSFVNAHEQFLLNLNPIFFLKLTNVSIHLQHRVVELAATSMIWSKHIVCYNKGQ